MPKYSLTIARYTLLECIRDRFIYLIFAGLLILGLLSLFVFEIAVTESQATQIALLASAIRLFAVITIILFIASSIIRELQDKSFELILAKGISRAEYYLGKIFACLIICLAISMVLSIPFIFMVQTQMVLIWSFSLFCELLIIACITLLCVLTWQKITFVFVSAMAFYLLARVIVTIQLIAGSNILQSNSLWHSFVTGTIDILAYLIPKFNEFTQTYWLVYNNAGWHDLIYVLVQTLIYVGIIIMATLFDLYRKELS